MRRPSTPTLLSPTLQDEAGQTQTPKYLQNYNKDWSVEVWEKIMMIVERNSELSWNRTKKIEAANLFQIFRPHLPYLWSNDSHGRTQNMVIWSCWSFKGKSLMCLQYMQAVADDLVNRVLARITCMMVCQAYITLHMADTWKLLKTKITWTFCLSPSSYTRTF